MFGGSALGRRSVARRSALTGLAGAALAAVGDVLILGRATSGPDFDRAAGVVVPPGLEVVERWRSLWNGTALSARRVRAGTLIGVVGIGTLAATGMRGALRGVEPGGLRNLLATAVACFAGSGVLTHVSCGEVIRAYQRALHTAVDPSVPGPGGPTAPTTLFAASAATTLGALAVFSAGTALAALRPLRAPGTGPAVWPATTAFPCVLAALVTFGRLPAPIGGYARPASISIGLMGYSCVAAAAATGAARRR